MRERSIRRNVAALIVAALTLGGAACTGGDAGSTPCSATQDCDDQNPCTTDACLASGCAHSPLPDGPGSLPQTLGDCRRNVCAHGVLTEEDDLGDTSSDGDECTTEGCINGVPSHLPAKESTVCHLPNGPGVCKNGSCEPPFCGPDAPCTDDNPCTADGCSEDGSVCVFVPLDDIPTPLTFQTPGDCRQNRCVNGKDTAAADDADLPDDGDPCTQDLCEQGKVKHPFQPAGSPCGDGMTCNGAGQCGS